MSEPKGILEKVAAIRDSLGVVRMQSSDGERSFEFAPAEDVLRKVRPKLKTHRLVVFPEVVGVELRKSVTAARLSITLRDLDAADVELVQVWEGEAETGLSAAIKNALKTFYLATFQIRTEPADAAPRRRAKKATGDDGLIGDHPQDLKQATDAARRAGLDEDEVNALVFARFGAQELGHVAKKRTVDLLESISLAGEHKAAGRDPLTREPKVVAT